MFTCLRTPFTQIRILITAFGEIHEPRVVVEQVDAIRCNLSQLLQHEVMVKHRTGILTFAIFLTVVFEISEQLLLLAINGNHRQACCKVTLNRSFNEAKLIVSVGMRLANLKQFLIELLAVAKLADKAANSYVACFETLCRERQKFCVHGIIGARQTGASNEHEHQTQFS